jgi:cardiolipin synthase A/B
MRSRQLSLVVLALAAAGVILASCAGAPAALPASPNTPIAEAAGAFFAAHAIPKYDSTAPAIYFSSEAWAARALELITGARDYIMISSFLVNYHPINAKILEALKTKASQGVRVYVMFDSSAYFTYAPDKKSYFPTALAYFSGSSVRVAEYNPMTGAKLFALPSLLNRDHRKFWIIDGEIFAAGGINLNYYSLAPVGELSNIDTFVELRGAGVLKQMVASFCATWDRYSPETIDPGSFAIRDAPTDSSVWLVDQTLDGPSLIDPLFDAVFQCAKKEVWMVQAYTFATPALLAKIKSATSRGVAVNLIVSTNSFRIAYEDAVKYCAKDILEAGAKIYVFDSPEKSFLHYKLLLADRELAVFGSPNYNFRSQYLSREIAVASADAGVAARAAKNVDELMRNAKPLTMEEARSYRGLKYLTAYLGMLFGG